MPLSREALLIGKMVQPGGIRETEGKAQYTNGICQNGRGFKCCRARQARSSLHDTVRCFLRLMYDSPKGTIRMSVAELVMRQLGI